MSSPPTCFFADESSIELFIRGPLPEIQVNDRPLIEIVIDAWAAIHAANHPAVIFVRQGVLVRLSRLSSEPLIEKASLDIVYGWLIRVACWVRVRGNRVRHARPPKEVARDMRVYPDRALPDLDAVTLVPVFDENGNLLSPPKEPPVARLW